MKNTVISTGINIFADEDTVVEPKQIKKSKSQNRFGCLPLTYRINIYSMAIIERFPTIAFPSYVLVNRKSDDVYMVTKKNQIRN